jgi:hypothetical protein
VAVETPRAAATSFMVTRVPAGGGIGRVTYGIAWPFSASRTPDLQPAVIRLRGG